LVQLGKRLGALNGRKKLTAARITDSKDKQIPDQTKIVNDLKNDRDDMKNLNDKAKEALRDQKGLGFGQESS
jgi:hypothetical protein